MRNFNVVRNAIDPLVYRTESHQDHVPTQLWFKSAVLSLPLDQIISHTFCSIGFVGGFESK